MLSDSREERRAADTAADEREGDSRRLLPRLIVSVALSIPIVLLAMVPAWWRHKRAAARSLPPADDLPPASATATANDPKIPDGI